MIFALIAFQQFLINLNDDVNNVDAFSLINDSCQSYDEDCLEEFSIGKEIRIIRISLYF